jgi:predicted anti-sigma-YlaC factor YlaD
VEWPAEQLKFDDYRGYRAGLVRARGFYQRATEYALSGLDLSNPSFRSSIMSDTEATLAQTSQSDVPLLFWLAASWLATIATDLEDPEMFGLMPIAAATMKRAYELEPDWDDGAIEEILISLEPALPMPGGAERAEGHYARCLSLQGGAKAGPHVALATAVALKAQDKGRFVALLDQALAIDLAADLGNRLANDYAQRKARFLLNHLDDLFLE